MTVRVSTGFREALLQNIRDDILDGAVLRLFSGSMPTSADAAENGDLLAEITVDGGSFNPGSQTNGLDFDVISSAADGSKTTLAKPTATTWKGTAVRAGTIGYGRLYANSRTAGSSTSAVRLDGNVSTVSGAAFVVNSVTTKVGVEVTVSEFNLIWPNQK